MSLRAVSHSAMSSNPVEGRSARRIPSASIGPYSLRRIRSALTPADIRQLNRQLQPMVAAGRIDLRFMGIHYLELHAMGFTPASGLRCTDAEFDQVCNWWKSLAPQSRANLLRNYRVNN